MDASKIYETPTLTVVGSFEALTQGSTTFLNHLDATYPTGTPFPQLTWS